MKTAKHLIIALFFATCLFNARPGAAQSTGDLLQQALYAEEVEGNLDSALRIYSQIIQNNSAPPNHVAQALYRSAMCAMKTRDETTARTMLEKLVARYPGQTELLERARPLLDELTDFDPALLMPADTLVYVEFGSPGRQVETILGTLKGTPYENPLAVVGGGNAPGANNRQQSPGNVIGALLNPSMVTEFKKIRSSAVGFTGLREKHPDFIAVLYPGKSDALRGLIQAALGVAGTAGKPVEGMQTVKLPEDMAVAFDDRVVIASRPAGKLQWCVAQYKGLKSDPTLASANKSFANVNKSQRQKNAFTLWANVDEAYAQALKLFPPGHIPPGLLSANAFADFANIDDIVISESLDTNAVSSRVEIRFKDGHHCLAYDLIRTPNITKAALGAVPSEAVAVASFALGRSAGASAERVRSQVQNITGMDLGREVFANLEQVVLFAMPAPGDSVNAATNLFVPARLGVALTSRNPEQTRQVLGLVLGAMNPAALSQINTATNRIKLGNVGSQELICHLDQAGLTTLLSLDRAIVDASLAALKSRQSALTAGPLSAAASRVNSSASKVLLVNLGGAIRLAGPRINPGPLTDEQQEQFQASLDQLARASDGTVIELRTDEQPNQFSAGCSVSGLPPLNQVFGPATQLAQLMNQAQEAAAAQTARQSTPALIIPAAKAPVIDGQEDEAWARAPRNKLENVIKSFGSGEKVQPISSPEDLSADFRALWDANNLYLFVEVSDDKLVSDNNPDVSVTVPSGSTVIPWWYDDSIEVYIDADNAKPAEYGNNDAHYYFTWNETKPRMGVHNEHGSLEGVEFAMVKTEKGYRTEIKIPWTTLKVQPVAGKSIGLDVQVDDDDNGQERDKKIAWRDATDRAWQSPQVFGNGLLGGLVGWWKLDETEGTVARDSSGAERNGTLVGGAKWAKGRNGGAIDLNGRDSFVRIRDKSAFNMGNEATVAAWVNFRSVPAPWTAIVTKGDRAWRLSTAEQDHRFHFGINDPSLGSDKVSVNAKRAVGANEWHYVVGVYGDNAIKLYVDGKLESSQAWDGGVGRDNFEVLIGENAERKGRFFDGLIDDVRIYNYALPENEIEGLATVP